MIIYRRHSGDSVFDSVKRAIEFETESDMKDYIVADNTPYISKDDIVIIDESIPDRRIGWMDMRHVCLKRYGNIDYIEKYGSPQCEGYCATIYKVV